MAYFMIMHVIPLSWSDRGRCAAKRIMHITFLNPLNAYFSHIIRLSVREFMRYAFNWNWLLRIVPETELPIFFLVCACGLKLVEAETFLNYAIWRAQRRSRGQFRYVKMWVAKCPAKCIFG